MNPDYIDEVLSRARCLYNEDEVEACLDTMAEAITAKLEGKNPILMCVMNGGLIASGKLAPRLRFPLEIDYLHCSRYRDKTRGGEFSWKHAPNLELKDRVVLLVDDVLDEGATLENIVAFCKEQGCSKVYVAVLVEKLHKHRLSPLKADFVGLQTDDYYLVGYGMDFKGYLRNAPGIYAIAESDCDSD